jgi:hypothetical protein
MSIAVLLATVMAFGFGSGDSWAATSGTQSLYQVHPQIVTINPTSATAKSIVAKTEEGNDNMKQDRKTKATKQFATDTVKGLNNSIENPKYQPGGKTNQAEKEDHDNTEEMKTEADSFFD